MCVFGHALRLPCLTLQTTVIAVVRFARDTGDAHVLSSADARLIALARGLYTARYGETRLRSEPSKVRVTKKRADESKSLPGCAGVGGVWVVLEFGGEREDVGGGVRLVEGSGNVPCHA